MEPDILAPGVNIEAAAPGNRFQKRSGTSMACAYIAGVAARIWRTRPHAAAPHIKNALLNTTRPLPPNQKHRCRTGIVQPQAALERLYTEHAFGKHSSSSPTPCAVQTPYIDPRFLSTLKRARPQKILEAVIIPKESEEQSFSSRELIRRVQDKTRQPPRFVRYFNHADMVHIQAPGSFFRCLLEHPDLLVCSAVDVGIFDF